MWITVSVSVNISACLPVNGSFSFIYAPAIICIEHTHTHTQYAHTNQAISVCLHNSWFPQFSACTIWEYISRLNGHSTTVSPHLPLNGLIFRKSYT